MALLDYWPLFRLRITTPRLELRIPDDDDLGALLDVAGNGVHDPDFMPFTTPWTDAASPAFERGALQYWWRCRSELSPSEWDLTFAVAHENRVIGVQSLSSKQFPELRTAETGSWLGLAHQGQGLGKEMRLAVLHFAFEQLQAHAVTSSAFADNATSQSVSLAVGYERNGVQYALQRGQPAEQVRFVMTRDRWTAARPDFPISVTGFEACRSAFEASGTAE